MAFEDYFSVQVFFILFRETIETAVIVSVLLAFLKQGFEHSDLVEGDDGAKISNRKDIYNQLIAQVWIGAVLGLLICFIVGAGIIFAFYSLGQNLWVVTEKIWEATFSLLASLMITVMGMAMLRINHMTEKWKVKVARIIIETHEGKAKFGLRYLSRKYAMAILPLVTTLREGLEAVMFLGGLGVNQPISSFPLAALAAVSLGSFIGWLMYRGGNRIQVHYFLIGSTCFLYLVAAGLFSRGVWFIELQQFITKVGQDVSEQGSGPGSYDVTKSVWHVNCCNPQTDGPWMIFNALLGWQNSATYGSVIAYNLYWAVIIATIFSMRYNELHGHLPFLPKSFQKKWHKRRHHHYTEEERDALLNRATLLYAHGDHHQPHNHHNHHHGHDHGHGHHHTRRPSTGSVDSSSPLIPAP